MVWFHVDDNLAFHTKVIEAGNGAMGLWVRAGAWSTGSLTDGFIPTRIAHQLGTQPQVDRLLKSGLWAVANGGYSFHDWDHKQFTKQEIESKREAERKRKAEQRKRKPVPAGQPDWDINGTTGGTTSPLSRWDSSRARPFPHPTPPHSGGVSNGTHHATITQTTPPKIFCEEHPDGTDRPCHKCKSVREQQAILDAEQHRQEAACRAAFQREIANCPDCDDNGWIDTDNGVDRCPRHDWAAHA